MTVPDQSVRLIRKPPVDVAAAAVGRAAAVRRARGFNGVTIGWNSIEGVIAIAAGLTAGSASLVGFGFDSAIEVSAAFVLLWRLSIERAGRCTKAADAKATKGVAISFALLAGYVSIESIRDLATEAAPQVSRVGLVLAIASLVVMPLLARAKRKVAIELGSAAAVAEAKQTNLCALMSAALLVGLTANWLLGWWWADPIAGLAIAALAAVEAVRTWRAESLADTCCG